MDRSVKINSCIKLQTDHLKLILNHLTINEISDITNELKNKTLFIIFQEIYLNIISIKKLKIQNNQEFPLSVLGIVKALKEEDEELITLGNGILLNEECVLTTLESVIERINESDFVAEKLMFVYENIYMFVKTVKKINYSNEISSILDSLKCKPLFNYNNNSLNNARFAILELENKLNTNINIPRLPKKIMDIFSIKKDFIFEMRMFSILEDKEYYMETRTVAKISEDMTIYFDKNHLIDSQIYNGSPIFLEMNGSLVFIGLYCLTKDIFKEIGKGYLINYSSQLSAHQLYQYESRDTMMTEETWAETRRSALSRMSTIITGTFYDKFPVKRISDNIFMKDQYSYNEESKKENENIIYKKGEIEFMSLDLLLTYIATDNTSEFNNCDIAKGFLLQYDAFLRPEMLLKKIKSLFHFYVNVKKIFPRSLILFINQWITHKWEDDFMENMEMIKEMKLFYLELSKFPEAKQDEELNINQIIEILEQDCGNEAEFFIQNIKIKKRTKNFYMKAEFLQPIVYTDYFDVLLWPEMEVARQISLYTHYYMSKIEMKELLSSRWTKKMTKYKESPNVMVCIERFNRLILWVCEEILSYDKSRVRAKVIEKFIKIANCCRKIYNFNDCINIISALNSLLLKYMTKTWNKLTTEGLILFTDLNNFISCDNNHRVLREETNRAKGKPYIPYLPLYLKELAYIDEGPKYLNNGMINIEKMKKVGAIIEDLFEFKSNAYLFIKSNFFIFLSNLKTKTEDELIELSNKIEPEFILYKNKSNKKRPSTSDFNLFVLCPSINEITIEMEKEIFEKSISNIIEGFFN